MYQLSIVTPPETEPVSVAELKDHLRLNTTDEDFLLSAFIHSARESFENLTGRVVHPTTYRQFFYKLTPQLYLMRGQVTEVTDFKYYDEADTLVDATNYEQDITGIPASVWLDPRPVTSKRKNPKGYVEFVAGWEVGTVPALVSLAIRLLASHFYCNRESHTDAKLDALPMGFASVCHQYETGLVGTWLTPENAAPFECAASFGGIG